jgi:hypothetical protein
MRYGAITDASGPDVISRAVKVFGPAGHGLRLTGRDMLSARFDSPLGHVAVEAERTDDARTDVTIETREYDREVRAFIESLPRKSALRRFIERRRR